jgi:hypothetical protein
MILLNNYRTKKNPGKSGLIFYAIKTGRSREKPCTGLPGYRKIDCIPDRILVKETEFFKKSG